MAITPHLVVGGAAKAMDFYVKAFGATEVLRCPPRMVNGSCTGT